MADLQKIVEDLSGLTLLEAAELTKLLEAEVGRIGCLRCDGRSSGGRAGPGGGGGRGKDGI